jgi:regulator of protease activity HflC (stomatin/prohibitin superfamily)
MSPYVTFLIIFAVYIVLSSVKILKEYERAVIFRLGRLMPVKGPGLIIVWPMIDKMERVSLRTITMDVPPQDVVTSDNVTVKVNAVVYFRPIEPDKAITEVEDYYYATSQMAQTSLRSILGQSQLDELLSKRDKLNEELQKVIDQQTEPWGIKVSTVEVKNVDIPETMQRALARQAEAERERRAKIIHAEGELQASEKLSQAAKVITAEPGAMQLRFMQTLTEVASGKSTVILFPLPIELIKPFMGKELS